MAESGTVMDELDRFKRRLIRSVARLEETKTQGLWKVLEKSMGRDCRPLWQRMRSLTLKKLSRLLVMNDSPDRLVPIARMSLTDWLLFDLVLVHEEIDVIDGGIPGQDSKNERLDSMKPLTDLFNLVQLFGIESSPKEKLADAWAAATVMYNQEGRQCSPMLLQKRWFQLKASTRSYFYKFWDSGFRQNKVVKPQATPSKLHVAIARRYPVLVTTAFPTWQDLRNEGRVILPHGFEERMQSKNLPKPSTNEPDLILIEPDVETIGVDSDSDEETSETAKDSTTLPTEETQSTEIKTTASKSNQEAAESTAFNIDSNDTSDSNSTDSAIAGEKAEDFEEDIVKSVSNLHVPDGLSNVKVLEASHIPNECEKPLDSISKEKSMEFSTKNVTPGTFTDKHTQGFVPSTVEDSTNLPQNASTSSDTSENQTKENSEQNKISIEISDSSDEETPLLKIVETVSMAEKQNASVEKQYKAMKKQNEAIEKAKDCLKKMEKEFLSAPVNENYMSNKSGQEIVNNSPLLIGMLAKTARWEQDERKAIEKKSLDETREAVNALKGLLGDLEQNNEVSDSSDSLKDESNSYQKIFKKTKTNLDVNRTTTDGTEDSMDDSVHNNKVLHLSKNTESNSELISNTVNKTLLPHEVISRNKLLETNKSDKSKLTDQNEKIVGDLESSTNLKGSGPNKNKLPEKYKSTAQDKSVKQFLENLTYLEHHDTPNDADTDEESNSNDNSNLKSSAEECKGKVCITTNERMKQDVFKTNVKIEMEENELSIGKTEIQGMSRTEYDAITADNVNSGTLQTKNVINNTNKPQVSNLSKTTENLALIKPKLELDDSVEILDDDIIKTPFDDGVPTIYDGKNLSQITNTEDPVIIISKPEHVAKMPNDDIITNIEIDRKGQENIVSHKESRKLEHDTVTLKHDDLMMMEGDYDEIIMNDDDLEAIHIDDATLKSLEQQNEDMLDQGDKANYVAATQLREKSPETPKFDLKLLMVPIVYTKKIETIPPLQKILQTKTMNIAQTIQNIIKETKPLFKVTRQDDSEDDSYDDDNRDFSDDRHDNDLIIPFQSIKPCQKIVIDANKDSIIAARNHEIIKDSVVDKPIKINTKSIFMFDEDINLVADKPINQTIKHTLVNSNNSSNKDSTAQGTTKSKVDKTIIFNRISIKTELDENSQEISSEDETDIHKIEDNIFQKPTYRQYNPISLCKNPDFNTRLKRLSVAFLIRTRNRELLKACKPMTIDLNKSFEDYMDNGLICVKSDKNVHRKSITPEQNQINTLLPSAMAAQSLFNGIETDIDKLIQTSMPNSSTHDVISERNKIIQLPDREKIKKVNSHLQTAEVPPLNVSKIGLHYFTNRGVQPGNVLARGSVINEPSDSAPIENNTQDVQSQNVISMNINKQQSLTQNQCRNILSTPLTDTQNVTETQIRVRHNKSQNVISHGVVEPQHFITKVAVKDEPINAEIPLNIVSHDPQNVLSQGGIVNDPGGTKRLHQLNEKVAKHEEILYSKPHTVTNQKDTDMQNDVKPTVSNNDNLIISQNINRDQKNITDQFEFCQQSFMSESGIRSHNVISRGVVINEPADVYEERLKNMTQREIYFQNLRRGQKCGKTLNVNGEIVKFSKQHTVKLQKTSKGEVQICNVSRNIKHPPYAPLRKTQVPWFKKGFSCMPQNDNLLTEDTLFKMITKLDPNFQCKKGKKMPVTSVKSLPKKIEQANQTSPDKIVSKPEKIPKKRGRPKLGTRAICCWYRQLAYLSRLAYRKQVTAVSKLTELYRGYTHLDYCNSEEDCICCCKGFFTPCGKKIKGSFPELEYDKEIDMEKKDEEEDSKEQDEEDIVAEEEMQSEIDIALTAIMSPAKQASPKRKAYVKTQKETKLPIVKFHYQSRSYPDPMNPNEIPSSSSEENLNEIDTTVKTNKSKGRQPLIYNRVYSGTSKKQTNTTREKPLNNQIQETSTSDFSDEDEIPLSLRKSNKELSREASGQEILENNENTPVKNIKNELNESKEIESNYIATKGIHSNEILTKSTYSTNSCKDVSFTATKEITVLSQNTENSTTITDDKEKNITPVLKTVSNISVEEFFTNTEKDVGIQPTSPKENKKMSSFPEELNTNNQETDKNIPATTKKMASEILTVEGVTNTVNTEQKETNPIDKNLSITIDNKIIDLSDDEVSTHAALKTSTTGITSVTKQAINKKKQGGNHDEEAAIMNRTIHSKKNLPQLVPISPKKSNFVKIAPKNGSISIDATNNATPIVTKTDNAIIVQQENEVFIVRIRPGDAIMLAENKMLVTTANILNDNPSVIIQKIAKPPNLNSTPPPSDSTITVDQSQRQASSKSTSTSPIQAISTNSLTGSPSKAGESYLKTSPIQASPLNADKVPQNLVLPMGTRILIMPNGQVTAVIDDGVELNGEQIDILNELIKFTQDEISKGVSITSLNLQTYGDKDIVEEIRSEVNKAANSIVLPSELANQAVNILNINRIKISNVQTTSTVELLDSDDQNSSEPFQNVDSVFRNTSSVVKTQPVSDNNIKDSESHSKEKVSKSISENTLEKILPSKDFTQKESIDDNEKHDILNEDFPKTTNDDVSSKNIPIYCNKDTELSSKAPEKVISNKEPSNSGITNVSVSKPADDNKIETENFINQENDEKKGFLDTENKSNSGIVENKTFNDKSPVKSQIKVKNFALIPEQDSDNKNVKSNNVLSDLLQKSGISFDDEDASDVIDPEFISQSDLNSTNASSNQLPHQSLTKSDHLSSPHNFSMDLNTTEIENLNYITILLTPVCNVSELHQANLQNGKFYVYNTLNSEIASVQVMQVSPGNQLVQDFNNSLDLTNNIPVSTNSRAKKLLLNEFSKPSIIVDLDSDSETEINNEICKSGSKNSPPDKQTDSVMPIIVRNQMISVKKRKKMIKLTHCSNSVLKSNQDIIEDKTSDDEIKALSISKKIVIKGKDSANKTPNELKKKLVHKEPSILMRKREYLAKKLKLLDALLNIRDESNLSIPTGSENLPGSKRTKHPRKQLFNESLNEFETTNEAKRRKKAKLEANIDLVDSDAEPMEEEYLVDESDEDIDEEYLSDASYSSKRTYDSSNEASSNAETQPRKLSLTDLLKLKKSATRTELTQQLTNLITKPTTEEMASKIYKIRKKLKRTRQELLKEKGKPVVSLEIQDTDESDDEPLSKKVARKHQTEDFCSVVENSTEPSKSETPSIKNQLLQILDTSQESHHIPEVHKITISQDIFKVIPETVCVPADIQTTSNSGNLPDNTSSNDINNEKLIEKTNNQDNNSELIGQSNDQRKIFRSDANRTMTEKSDQCNSKKDTNCSNSKSSIDNNKSSGDPVGVIRGNDETVGDNDKGMNDNGDDESQMDLDDCVNSVLIDNDNDTSSQDTDNCILGV